MPRKEILAWLTLLRCSGLGSSALIELVERFGSASAALAADRAAWTSGGVPQKAWAESREGARAQIESDLAWCDSPRQGLIPWNDPRYPESLRNITSRPAALYFRGDVELLQWPQIAVVGSRNATPQGLEIAENFSGELVRRGLVVTSGLALGIDAAAHRGALGSAGPTIAVCATGLDRVYPARNRTLAEAIVDSGLMISEFNLGSAPRRESFPRRNRLISGLSLGVLVVEATRDSGSLITARLAGEQGREVFAIPGSIHNIMARGCHRLIRQGAKLVETVDDILEEIGDQVGQWLKQDRSAVHGSASESEPLGADLSETHQKLLLVMGDRPMDMDSIIEKSGVAAELAGTLLTELELMGRIQATMDGQMMRTR